MSKVKMKLLVSRSGPDGALNAGDEVEVGADEAERMVAAGQALPVRAGAAKVEKATKKRAASEKAAK